MKVAIFGATGAVGFHTAQALRERGAKARVVGRSATRLRAAFGPSSDELEHCVTDVATLSGCVEALRGCDGLLHAVGLPYRARAFAAYPELMRTAMRAAEQAGVRRVVQISNVYVYGRPRMRPVHEDHPLQPCSVKGRYRLAQERVTLTSHSAALETVVLRLPNFFGARAANSAGAHMLRALLAGDPVPLLEPSDAPQEYVAPSDVGKVVARLFAAASGFGQALNMAGSGLATPRELAALLAAAAGTPLRVRVLGATLQRVLGLFMRDLAELRELSYLAETPVVLDESRLRQSLDGPIEHTPLAAAAQAWVEDERARNRSGAPSG